MLNGLFKNIFLIPDNDGLNFIDLSFWKGWLHLTIKKLISNEKCGVLQRLWQNILG